ncbi:hypothetical protein PR048_011976 [Dryococelus australis]|uniref:Uncharacterized protein n=1 Tax=Dryococelus australis TaxID=614101 RepID=A0ABQ9HN59_9NEOP|nr:hypothetical protein PR048_011976 [Dryococelus australis]
MPCPGLEPRTSATSDRHGRPAECGGHSRFVIVANAVYVTAVRQIFAGEPALGRPVASVCAKDFVQPVQNQIRGRGCKVVRLLASRQGEPGWIPGDLMEETEEVKPLNTSTGDVLAGFVGGDANAKPSSSRLTQHSFGSEYFFWKIFPSKTFRKTHIADFRMWESCRTMPLVGGFPRGSPISPALAFRRCSMLTSLHLSLTLKTSIRRWTLGGWEVVEGGRAAGLKQSPTELPSNFFQVSTLLCTRPRGPGGGAETERSRKGVVREERNYWAPLHNVCSVVVTPLESRRATSCGYNSSHPVWHALYECSQDIHGDSSPFLLQPFHELSNGFCPRQTSPHPTIQFVPNMF